MEKPNRVSKTLCIIGSSLLLIIAIFHGSGFNYVNDLVLSSDVSELIKRIFPVLFILPSIQLLGLATFGFMATSMKNQANKILIPLAILVLVNAALSFYLDALIPGFILVLPSFLFAIVAYRNKVHN